MYYRQMRYLFITDYFSVHYYPHKIYIYDHTSANAIVPRSPILLLVRASVRRVRFRRKLVANETAPSLVIRLQERVRCVIDLFSER